MARRLSNVVKVSTLLDATSQTYSTKAAVGRTRSHEVTIPPKSSTQDRSGFGAFVTAACHNNKWRGLVFVQSSNAMIKPTKTINMIKITRSFVMRAAS